MIQKKNHNQIMQDFRLRRGRQLVAIAAALLLIIFLAVMHRWSGLFGQLKNTVLSMQLLVIAAFIGFSSVNWKCPSCGRYLGQDINRSICKKCGARLR